MSLKTLALSVGLFLLTFSGFAQQTPSLAPEPTPPPGQNPATYPVPRTTPKHVERFQAILAQSQSLRAGNVDLLFEGDSITGGWLGQRDLWQKAYGSRKVATFGVGGDRTQHVLWRLQHGQVDGLSPKLIVILIGTNNIPTRDTVPQIYEGVAAIVKEYRTRCPKSHILLLGVFPRGEKPEVPFRAKITELNKQIATLEDKDHVTFLDFGKKFLAEDGTLPKEIMPDFLHPNKKGYEIWIEAIQPIVEKYVP